MKAQLTIEGLEGHNLEVHAPALLQGPKLTLDGVPAPRGKGRNVYSLQRTDGQPVTVRLRPSLLYDLPSVEVNGTRHQVAEPLEWYQYLLGVFPLVLVLGGLIGIILALALFLINIRVWRADIPSVAKVLIVLTLSLGVPILYYLASFLLVLATQGS